MSFRLVLLDGDPRHGPLPRVVSRSGMNPSPCHEGDGSGVVSFPRSIVVWCTPGSQPRTGRLGKVQTLTDLPSPTMVRVSRPSPDSLDSHVLPARATTRVTQETSKLGDKEKRTRREDNKHFDPLSSTEVTGVSTLVSEEQEYRFLPGRCGLETSTLPEGDGEVPYICTSEP